MGRGECLVMAKNAYIKDKKRVIQYGEVFTPPHIVNAMLDLVKDETQRIDSRFYEPACGTGNFLVEILRRKLEVVKRRYSKHQMDYERYAVLAISSLYGIEILEDNVRECQLRLYQAFNEAYTGLFTDKAKDNCRQSVQYILSQNIVHGDALKCLTIGNNPQPIIFPEWAFINSSLIKRRDFRLEDLMQENTTPEPVKEYYPVHFLELANAYNDEL